MKDAFDDGFITRLDTAEDRISELYISEDLSTETYKNWNEKKKKDQKTQDRITKNLGIKDVICNVNSRRRRKRERSRRNIWSNNDWECPQINVRHQATDPENNKQDKCQKQINKIPPKWQVDILH